MKFPIVDLSDNNDDIIEANEQLGNALTEIGMAAGLPKPRPGATWGAPEVLAAVRRLQAIEQDLVAIRDALPPDDDLTEFGRGRKAVVDRALGRY